MSVGALEPKFWKAFCQAIGREDLIAGTVWPDHSWKLKKEIREIFLTKTKAEWTRIFSEADACTQPVLDLKESLLEDEQVQAREMVVDVPLPLHEDLQVRQLGNPVKLSETPCEYRFAGYPLGYHTKEVIEGLSMDYDQLAENGVFD